MKPIIQYKNKLNIKNFIYNLQYLKSKKEIDIEYQNTKLKVLKYFENLYNKNEMKKKRKKNKSNNMNSSKYTSSLKDLKEIIKRISKSVNKEKMKLKNQKDNRKNKKGKSANLLKNKINRITEKEDIMNNIKIKLRKELELKKEENKKVFNIKPIEVNEMDLIIENKRKMRNYINDSSNISLPLLMYSRQISKFTKPLLIGLNNLGFTCYLNAILQCLNQTDPLTNYFLSEEGVYKVKNNNLLINDSSSLQLSPSYLEVVNNLWDINKNNKSYSPIHFYEKLNEMNKKFILNKPNDSKDLLKFIFKQFHRELNTKESKLNNNKKEFSFEQYDRVKTFKKFLVDFTNNNCSIISNNFFGIIEIHKACINCKKFFRNQGIIINPIIYDFKIYNMLIFPLEEVKKMKMKNNDKEDINKISIYDCFYYYQNKRTPKEEKKTFCKRCNQLTEFINKFKLFNAPNILIIILDRGKGNAYNIQIEFDEKIDLTDFIAFKQNNIIYNLYGVVTHLGKSRDEGHFVAACKNLIDNLWYKYNDSSILKINNIQTEVLDYGKPYILFFRKHF